MTITTQYRTYLKSEEWDARRREALHRAHYRCGRCGEAKPLQVHHLTYTNIFNEPQKDLQPLCLSCHRWVHMPWWLKTAIIPFKIVRWFWKRMIGF